MIQIIGPPLSFTYEASGQVATDEVVLIDWTVWQLN